MAKNCRKTLTTSGERVSLDFNNPIPKVCDKSRWQVNEPLHWVCVVVFYLLCDCRAKYDMWAFSLRRSGLHLFIIFKDQREEVGGDDVVFIIIS